MLFLLSNIIPDNECGKAKMRLRTLLEIPTDKMTVVLIEETKAINVHKQSLHIFNAYENL